MVAQDAIVQEAKKKAIEMLKTAQANAREVKKSANDYVDNLMNNTEKFMAAVMQDIKKQKSAIRESRSK